MYVNVTTNIHGLLLKLYAHKLKPPTLCYTLYLQISKERV